MTKESFVLLPLCSNSCPVTRSEMDQTASSRRTRPTPQRPDLYSTVVIHNDDDDDDGGTDRERRRRKPKSLERDDEDLYGTVVYKGDGGDDEEEEDEASLPPLLKRLPKDFGGGAPMDFDDEEEEEGNDFGTMIVKTDRNRPRSRASSSSTRRSHYSAFSDSRQESPRRRPDSDSDSDSDDGGGGFSTFVVRSGNRESLSGTVVRKTAAGAGSTMDRAVASMQAVGELGFGKQRRGSGSSHVEEPRQTTKISCSSIPDSVTKEDPTVKYELLNELGGFLFISLQCCQFSLQCGLATSFCFAIFLRMVFGLLEMAGKGSYGAVYKARDKVTSELVAIKVISLSEGVRFCFLSLLSWAFCLPPIGGFICIIDI